MTIDKDSNPSPRIHRPGQPGGQPQAHERLSAEGGRDGEDLDPRNDRGQGSERSESQGRGNDPDRG